MSVDTYRRFLRRWADRAAGDDGAGRDIAQRRQRRVTVFETDDGMHGVRGLLPADHFAFFENELRRLAETRRRADHPDADNVPAKNSPARSATLMPWWTWPGAAAGSATTAANPSAHTWTSWCSSTSRPSRRVCTTRVAASSTTTRRSHPSRHAACCATPTSSLPSATRQHSAAPRLPARASAAAFSRPSAAARAGSSTWATAAAPPTARSAKPSSPVTAPALRLAATGRTGCARSITSSRGPRARGQISTTSPCSAAAATTTSTTPPRTDEPTTCTLPQARRLTERVPTERRGARGKLTPTRSLTTE